MMSVGSRIRKRRLEKGLTQMDMGLKLGMGRLNVGHIENGRTEPTAKVLDKIASILDTTPDYLLGHTENPEPRLGSHEIELTQKDEKDIATQLQKIMDELDSDQALAFHGEPLNDTDKELLRISLENSMRLATQIAKQKFTPKKYRK